MHFDEAKMLDKIARKCYTIITEGEGSATREELADPRESVRRSPKTPTARSPVARYTNVNQAIRFATPTWVADEWAVRGVKALEGGRQDEPKKI